jgi:hypothetical protein
VPAAPLAEDAYQKSYHATYDALLSQPVVTSDGRPASRWGMRGASDFFGRCCPMLLDLGAIAYWSVPGASQYRTLHREIEQITQCVIVVGEGRLRISKAEGRPPGVQGQLFRYSVQDGTLRLEPSPAAARVGAVLPPLDDAEAGLQACPCATVVTSIALRRRVADF